MASLCSTNGSRRPWPGFISSGGWRAGPLARSAASWPAPTSRHSGWRGGPPSSIRPGLMAGPEPGVLLLGSDFKALGVARSLGRRGVSVAVVDSLPRSAWFSRHVSRRFHWREPMLGTAFVDFLLDLARTSGTAGSLLWPAQDDALEAVAR